MSFQAISSVIQKEVKLAVEMTDAEVETAVANAVNTFEEWRKTDYQTRAQLLYTVSGILLSKKNELAHIITSEMGKTLIHAEGEIKLSSEIFGYFAKNAKTFLADKILNSLHGKALIKYCPVGVLLGIQPWDFPFYQIARFTAPNILIGNTVLVKHANKFPQCAMAIEEIFIEAGAPFGLYNNLLLSNSRTSNLVSDKRIRGVSLTGSETAGVSLSVDAGKYN